MQASMIVDACDRKDRTTLEFAYHFFNNKLRHVSQLMRHFDFDIADIEGTEQGRVCYSGDKNLAQLVQARFRGRLEEYLKADVVGRGAELLTAMTASPYLPADPYKRLKVRREIVICSEGSQIVHSSVSYYSTTTAAW